MKKRVNRRPNRGGGKFNNRGNTKSRGGKSRGRGKKRGGQNNRGFGYGEKGFIHQVDTRQKEPRRKKECNVKVSITSKNVGEIQTLLQEIRGTEDDGVTIKSQNVQSADGEKNSTSKTSTLPAGLPLISPEELQDQQNIIRKELYAIGFNIADIDRAFESLCKTASLRDPTIFRSESTFKLAVLDWLFINLKVENLPKKLIAARSLDRRELLSQVQLLGFSLDDTPKEHKEITSKFDKFISSMTMIGFKRTPVVTQLVELFAKEKDTKKVEFQCTCQLLNQLVPEKEKQEYLKENGITMDFGEIDPDELEMNRADEIVVLESMFADQFEQITSSEWKITLQLEGLSNDSSTAEDEHAVLMVYFPEDSKYPYSPPLCLFRSTTIVSSSAYQITKRVHLQSFNYLGAIMIYNLISDLPTIVDTVRKEEAKKMKASEKKKKIPKQAAPPPSKTKSKGTSKGTSQGSKSTIVNATIDRLELARQEEEERQRNRRNRIAALKKLMEEEEREASKTDEDRQQERDLEARKKAKKQAKRDALRKKERDAKEQRKKILNDRLQKQRELRKQRNIPKYMRSGHKARSKQSIQEGNPTIDQTLLQNWKDKKDSNSKFKKMQQSRAKLPSFKKRDEIMDAIRNHQVVVISGETGCGKTTQIPQFILQDYITQGNGSRCRIVCTQPRRISAIAVAERVADERAEKIGSTVGYQIRLEAKKSDKTRLLFCTTGVLLRKLQGESDLDDISHVIMDEIHERDLNSEFLLIIMKSLLQRRKDLKLILMSATLKAELFSDYFGGCPMIHIEGFTFPVDSFYLEDIFDMTDYILDPTGDCAVQMDKKVGKKNNSKVQNTKRLMKLEEKMDRLYDGYKDTTKKNMMILKEDAINYELIAEVVEYIDKTYDKNDGAVLIFLPGLMEISNLYEILHTRKSFTCLPLHSSLSSRDQAQIFKKPKSGTRKVIISTNIAETSITINDVLFVIDAGRVKETRYDPQNSMSALVETWISKANVKQRKGRAGRVRQGYCFHMYSSNLLQRLKPYQIPEILRVSLQELILQIKLLGYGNVREFLGQAIEPPTENAIHDGLTTLHELSALDEENDLTALGYHLATLPVAPKIGKMILFGVVFCCLEPVLVIAATLGFKSPFVSPFDKRDEADQRKRKFAGRTKSDLLGVVFAYREFEKMDRKRRGRDFCYMNYLSWTTLKMIRDLKQQFTTLLRDLEFLTVPPVDEDVDKEQTGDWSERAFFNRNSGNVKLIKAVITAALYPNVCRIKPVLQFGKVTGLSLFTKKRTEIAIHPASILFKESELKSNERYLMYHEKVKTSKVYIRDGTIVTPIPLLLFGGELKVLHMENIVVVDDWIRVNVGPQVGVLMKELRMELEKVLLEKIQTPEKAIYIGKGKKVIDTIVDLIVHETTETM